jgi:uncharacterized protein with ParB-like and HNH nuclease domain
MTLVRNLNIRLDGIAHTLSDNYLLVPRYQRSYAWEGKNVNDLLQDIGGAINDSSDEYFIGSIVASRSDVKSAEIVDGQQRLATISILLASIRDYFYENDEPDRGKDIDTVYLQTRDLRTQESKPKLQLNAYDNDYFAKTILSPPDSALRGEKVKRESHERILNAQRIIRDYFDNVTKTSSKPVDLLMDWVDFLHSNVKVIWVEVPDHANAFIIFETLNDRGLDLSIADLLKNYLFGKAGNRIDEVQQRWTSMLGSLDTVGRDEVVLTYLRHLWSSLYGATREKALYIEIKKKITSRQKAIDIADDLSNNSVLYAAMLNPAHELWRKYGSNVKSHIETLTYLKLEQYKPLLLSILFSFDKPNIQEAVKYLVSCSVRYLIVGGLGGGVIERVYSDAAVNIRKNLIKNTKGLKSFMSRYVPTDIEFKNSFKTARVSQAYLARYYLIGLEKTMQGEKQPEFVPNSDEQALNLEHILPESPSEEWEITPEIAKAYYKRIGNLTLLKRKINENIGNKGFGNKKTEYEKSKISITKKLGTYASWSISDIEKRQKELAELAVKTWPI